MTDEALKVFLTDGFVKLIHTDTHRKIPLRPLFQMSGCAERRCGRIMNVILRENNDRDACYTLDEEEYEVSIHKHDGTWLIMVLLGMLAYVVVNCVALSVLSGESMSTTFRMMMYNETTRRELSDKVVDNVNSYILLQGF